VVLLEEGTGMDTFGGLEGIAFGSRGEICSAVDNASSWSSG
jgi:hypothetical protein